MENSSIRTDVALEEFIDIVRVLQEASKNAEYSLKLLEIGKEKLFEESVHVKKFNEFDYEEREFDVVSCIDYLESAADPVSVISGLNRIGGMKYIRTIDRNYESLVNVESSKYAGFKKHKWLVELKDNRLIFTPKDKKVLVSYQPYPTGNRYINIFWKGLLHANASINIKLEDLRKDYKNYAGMG